MSADQSTPVLKSWAAKSRPTIVDFPELQQYMEDISLRPSPAQEDLARAVQESPVGIMSSTRDESNFLAWLAALIGARKVIEVGVFLGATTLAIAQALPEDGKILALDVSDEFTSVGLKHWKDAGVAHKVQLKIQPAVESLQAATQNPSEMNSYDLAFIDADKYTYDSYYELCLRLIRPGGIIAVDNVFWHGKIFDDSDQTRDTAAIRAINAKIQADTRVAIATIPCADGLTLCRKL